MGELGSDNSQSGKVEDFGTWIREPLEVVSGVDEGVPVKVCNGEGDSRRGFLKFLGAAGAVVTGGRGLEFLGGFVM